MARLLRYVLGLGLVGLVVVVAGYVLVLPQLGRSVEPVDVSGLTGDPARGAYLAVAAGCLTCHTDYKKKGQLLAGGPAIETPFGAFYGPNITPDTKHGIGGWTVEQFSMALAAGRAPNGNHYFPSFPYTSYAAMKPQDIVDIKSYLDTVPPVTQASRPHDLGWPFSDRAALGAWKLLNFDPVRNVELDRGAYLVNVLGHCGECHTQRNVLGGKSGVADHVKIGSDVLVAAASAVAGNVPSRNIVMGVPAVKRDEAMASLMSVKRLPRMFAKIEKLQAQFAAGKNQD